MNARAIARRASRACVALILLCCWWQAIAYDVVVTPHSQFHIDNGGPAEFSYAYLPDGQSSHVKKLADASYAPAQYTRTRFVILPQSGDLTRIEEIDVQLTLTSQQIGEPSESVANVRSVSPFVTLYEFTEPTSQTIQLKTNVLYQAEAIAVARGFPAENLVELHFQMPYEQPSLPRFGLGEWNTCVVRADATPACWGLNDYGQSSPPSASFRQITAGWIHACGLKTDGTLACWGYNGEGRATPPSGTFVQVTSGRAHNCALRTDGTITCWGENQFGNASPPAGTFKFVGAGQQHTCGVRTDGSLVCWGADFDDQASPPSGTFLSVSGGLFHSCGLRTDRTVACWGDNDYGQGSPPAGLFRQIDSGWHFNCGLRDDLSIACWGINSDSQLNAPPGPFKQVDAGLWHTCGVRTDNTLSCWGDNSRGQAPSTSVQPAVLPDGETGSAYDQQLVLQGTPGYSAPALGFSVIAGALPAGVTMDADGHLSGVPSTAGGYSFVVAAQDVNGFTTSRSYFVSIAVGDSTPPAIEPIVTGTMGSNGWYVGDVSVHWQVSDAESPVESTTGCNDVSLTTDSSDATFTCHATSTGGTSSASVTVKRDATSPTLAPEVSPTMILLGGSGSAVANASDALSGLASSECGAVDTTSVGAHSVSCTATDLAGNSANALAEYTVIYGFIGFQPPVDNAPAVNLATAGRTIPFKWRLVDANGAPVTSLAGVQLAILPMNCDTNAPSDEVEQYVQDAIAFVNHGNGDYQYNWQTPKSFEGSCKRVVINLGDGSTRYALFRFR